MDKWQKQINKRLSEFIGNIVDNSKSVSPDVKIAINHKEAYVLLKALEDQQRYLNPLIEVQVSQPQETK